MAHDFRDTILMCDYGVPAATPGTRTPHARQRPVALVVDDSPMMVAFLRRRLARLGCDVIVAPDPGAVVTASSDARRLVRIAQLEPDVLLSKPIDFEQLAHGLG